MTAEPGVEFRRDVADATLRVPVAAALGLVFTAIADGRAEACLPWRPEHSYEPGTFQAGPITALADFAGGAAAASLLPPTGSVTTVDITAKFLAEARGDRLIARARVLHPGRGSTVTAVDLHIEGHDEICASALVTFRNNRPAT